ncbi:MAG TPA: hypothetical protein VM513_21525 [Kofleriaceae bacterium]|nr:hypothetical protein [Kofleriaceae bacterium]
MRAAHLLIAAALAGSVSVADAQVRRTDDRYNESYRYGPGWSQRPGYRSFALTGHVNTRRPRNLIDVNYQPLDRVTVQATGGRVFVRRISVEFGNHNVVDYPVNAWLRPGQIKTIDTRGRRVFRMEVMVDPRYRGSYQVIATPGHRRYGPPIGMR